MTKAPLAAYPALRMRRLRQADWIRRLVRETVLTPADLIWSLVVHEGEGQVSVGSMPGISRLSVKDCAAAAREARSLGIPAIAVFPHIDGAKKDATGKLAHDPNGVVANAVKAIMPMRRAMNFSMTRPFEGRKWCNTATPVATMGGAASISGCQRVPGPA